MWRLLLLGLIASGPAQNQLPTGKRITPLGKHVSVGSYPINMVLTKDKRFAVVTTIGFREFLSVIRLSDGKITSQVDQNKEGQGLYYGLAVDPISGLLYVSNGAADTVSRFTISASGALKEAGKPIHLPSSKERELPWHPAGLAVTSDGRKLVTINNQTNEKSDFKGAFSVFDVASGKELVRGATAGFPFAGALVTKGVDKDRKLYVGSERDGVVEAFDIRDGRRLATIRTGAAPTGLLLSNDQKTLYVTNAESDTVSFVDTATDRVRATVLLRPALMRGLQGATPTGLCVSEDGQRLYVALADMNAIGVVDVKRERLTGYVPTGWLPTSVLALDGKLFVANAKGESARNPNSRQFQLPGMAKPGHYIQDLIDGSVRIMSEPKPSALRTMTSQVIANNGVRAGLDQAYVSSIQNPGIKHVIYIIKENRTYDNILGDLPQGNGDAKQCLFPRKITPNLHALAERFALLDNFNVCAEVSQDGWLWSTAGMITPYASRNTPYNYSDRGRNYDTEGSNNGVPIDLLDIPDVTTPSSGYIWDNCRRHNVSYRNYGFFNQFDDPADKRFDSKLIGTDNATKKALLGHTCNAYKAYDTNYSDSDAYHLNGFTWKSFEPTYGPRKLPSRFAAWKEEFEAFVAQGTLPQFMMVRMGNDHTMGTREGMPTPQSMVADNDYAVAELVEAVSKSSVWNSTAIFVVEDDAQSGYDHVDAHRATAYVISPFVKRGVVDSRFYNTDSVLRTMELLLGIPPMNQYDAVAAPLDIFSKEPSNAEPFEATKPDPAILCALNKHTAYRASYSSRLSALKEESESDEELNDILWGAIKGANVPRPEIKNPWRVAISTRKSRAH
ncbi:MAG: hypothetical protein JSS72_10770 [Armatimonadetes bacterium]|nr:hypothetical protein [Armatimonadota bacterium]